MRLLLDTHTFIWSISERSKLSAKAVAAIENSHNDIHVSAVSLWEIAIKVRIGKLDPLGRNERSMTSIAEMTGFQLIPLNPDEAASSSELTEDTHFDPFDRMLIWQAISRKMTLISGDREFERFKADGLKLLWE